MPTSHSSLRLVSERFGPLRDRAVRAYERDPDFRDLCDEYQACAETLASHEERPGSSEAVRRLATSDTSPCCTIRAMER